MPDSTPDPLEGLPNELVRYLSPPDDLSPAGRDLWTRHLANLLAADTMPSPAEHRLLSDACYSVTRADRLAAEIDAAGGLTVPGPRGTDRPHPLLLELDRTTRTTAALLKQLGQSDRSSSSRANGASRWNR